MRTHLTERLVKGAQPQPGRKVSLNDDLVVGLALRIYPTGRKAFVLRYRAEGRERLYTIGDWPDWSVTAARERAKELKRAIDRGEDPTGERSAPTVGDLIDRYIAEHLPKLEKKHAREQELAFLNIVKPEWGARKIGDITEGDVTRLLNKIAEGRAPGQNRPAPVRANRMGAWISKMFNLAVKTWKFGQTNPASGFHARPENACERFLSRDEIERIATALAATPNQRAADVVRMCMLTGARGIEVRRARFDQFDLESGVWVKQSAHTKQRKIHRLTISADTVEVVRRRADAVSAGCPWLFPGNALDDNGRPKPMDNIRKAWVSICRAADLAVLAPKQRKSGEIVYRRDGTPVMVWKPTVRIHDLRHTFASEALRNKVSLETVGKLLGHTQPRTTSRYAHLAEQPQREAVDLVAEALRPRPRLVASND